MRLTTKIIIISVIYVIDNMLCFGSCERYATWQFWKPASNAAVADFHFLFPYWIKHIHYILLLQINLIYTKDISSFRAFTILKAKVPFSVEL